MTPGKTDFTYGNAPSYPVERLCVDREGAIRRDLLRLPRPQGGGEALRRALADIDRSWRVIRDRRTGAGFEIAESNLDAPREAGVDAEVSTASSSISGNRGNALEFAANSTLHPGRRRLYIASFGNGGSDYFGRGERDYLRRTGRCTRTGEGADGRSVTRALPTVEALHRALEHEGLMITRLSANSAGGAYATALLLALPVAQVTHAYFKSRPNISDLGIAGLLVGLVFHEMIRNTRRYRRISQDPWKPAPALIREVQRLVPRVYAGSGRAACAPAKERPSGLTRLITNARAFGRGPRSGHPAAVDTREALRRHPRLLATFHFPRADRLIARAHDLTVFLEQLHAGGHLAPGRVELLTMPGTHVDHAFYPGLRMAAERHAWGRASA